ncbi:Intraflagellar transport protein 80 [Nowakowskiella sp. JEL0078]|nr:Intraflagellar transport protein 80 [Nowakowskiella sp. JEL0078]
MAWTPDGTQIACAGGSGTVLFGHVTDRRYEWKNHEVILLDDKKVKVIDVLQGNSELLDFRDRIIKVSLGFGHLIVATSSQCYVYSEKNWNTPCIIDLSSNGRIVCIKQCLDYFCLVDNFTGIQVFSYEARLISQPKYPGLRPELITPPCISISNDHLAIKDRTDEKAIYLFEVQSGRQLPEMPIRFWNEIQEIALGQSGNGTGVRQIIILDKNRDLYLMPTVQFKRNGVLVIKKLGAMVETVAWNNDGSDVLVAMADGRFVIWPYPNAIFVDEDVVALTKFERDGSNISPFPGLLQECARKKQWEEAIRLCRYAKMKELWACLACMALNGQDLNTAEVAYASIDEIQKVQYICFIRDIPTAEARSAEMALMRKQPKEAENILLTANLVYRAIRMWINLFEWERALELAVKYKTHVDTGLDSVAIIKFTVKVDWESIQNKIKMEDENEKTKPITKSYQ